MLTGKKQTLKLTRKIKMLMKKLEEARSNLIFEIKNNEEIEMQNLNSMSTIIFLE